MARTGVKMGTLPENLPTDAAPAWRCYLGMIASKDAHFEYLERLDRKYQHGGTRTLVEIAHLEGLLQAHNESVAAFTAEQKALAARNAESHKKFISVLSDSNAHLGNSQAS
ncbi:MAG: hypothetical protein ACU84Q_07680 [Gammaproteobacteria bacterium]